MNGDIVPIKAHDVIKRDYKGHQVTFTFDSERHTWSWQYVRTAHFTFGGRDCPSLDDAIKRAYTSIDQIIG